MEPERTRSSVIARLTSFHEPRTPTMKQRFLPDNYQSKVAMIGIRAEKMRVVPMSETLETEKQMEGFVSMRNITFSSCFAVTPTKELCRAYLLKPTSFASNHVIEARATPPHRREKATRLPGSRIHGQMAEHRNVGRRVELQNLKTRLKLKHRNCVNPVKPETGKKENSLRCFSPVSAPRDSHLGYKETGQIISHGHKAEERKKLFDGSKPRGGQDKCLEEVASNSMATSISMDSGSSLGHIESEILAADVKLRLTSSTRVINEAEHVDSLQRSDAHTEFQTTLEEGNQTSPVSVLEPIFDDETFENCQELPHLNFLGKAASWLLSQSKANLSTPSRLSSNGLFSITLGLEKQLEILTSESDENKDKEPIGSSYTDDVLAEAVLGNGKRVFADWDSVELPVNAMIFEMLEKKYVDRTSWRRSERRLLFDRVNSGFIKILESYVAASRWNKPVSRRLSTQGLKQELQTLLVRQEQRAKNESSAKTTAIDGDEWLELEADIEPVVRELGTMLVDELLAELVHIM